MSRYSWMPEEQKKLFDRMCKAFGFNTFADIGRYLGLNNPSDSVKSIFKSQKPNVYIQKLIEEKEKYNKSIEDFEAREEIYESMARIVGPSIKALTEFEEALLRNKKPET